MENNELLLLTKAGAGIVGLLGAIYKLRQFYELSRSSLKSDLEILALLEKGGVNHALVKDYVEEMTKRIYAKKEAKLHVYSTGDFVFGVIFLAVFGVWTAILLHGHAIWWALLTGFCAFTGLGGILNGLDPKSKEPQ